MDMNEGEIQGESECGREDEERNPVSDNASEAADSFHTQLQGAYALISSS